MSLITASVGQGGTNRNVDVRTIQRLLHDNGYFPTRPDQVNQAVLRRSIRNFQRSFMAQPTGLIEPDSISETNLIITNPIAAATGTLAGWVDYISGGPVAQAVVLSRVAPSVAEQNHCARGLLPGEAQLQ